jgi:hypothetical protein
MIEGFFSIDTASADASINGDPWLIRTLAGFSIQVHHGACTGTFAVQARNDESMPWSTVSDIDLAAPSGSEANEIVEVGNARSREYRVVYTRTGGSGFMRVCIHAKGD